jgi:hypothetical protein
MERTKSTIEDARLLVELEKICMTEPAMKAISWFFKEFVPKKITNYTEYKRQYPMGSDGSMAIATISSFYELSSTLIQHGLLNEDLFFDAFPPVNLFWESVKPIAYGEREEFKNPRLYENMELLNEREKKWEKSHPAKVRLVTA